MLDRNVILERKKSFPYGMILNEELLLVILLSLSLDAGHGA